LWKVTLKQPGCRLRSKMGGYSFQSVSTRCMHDQLDRRVFSARGAPAQQLVALERIWTPLDGGEAATPENILRITMEVDLSKINFVSIRPDTSELSPVRAVVVSRMQPTDMLSAARLIASELQIGGIIGDEQHLNPGSLV
jgi:hypothetical protein